MNISKTHLLTYFFIRAWQRYTKTSGCLVYLILPNLQCHLFGMLWSQKRWKSVISSKSILKHILPNLKSADNLTALIIWHQWATRVKGIRLYSSQVWLNLAKAGQLWPQSCYLLVCKFWIWKKLFITWSSDDEGIFCVMQNLSWILQNIIVVWYFCRLCLKCLMEVYDCFSEYCNPVPKIIYFNNKVRSATLIHVDL